MSRLFLHQRRRRAFVGFAAFVFAVACDDSPDPAGPDASGNFLTFAAVSAGLDHTCAIVGSGDAYCWGRGPTGALGADTVTSAIAPVLVLGGNKFSQISAGEEHTCALDVQGETMCWGANSRGQLGVVIGDTARRTRPVRVGITQPKFKQLSGGAYHTCAITLDNRAYCWGWNVFGQIGNSSTIGQQLPVEVHGNLRFSTLSAGVTHTCGITMAGSAYCWGNGVSGQLGDGATTTRLAATPVTGGLTFTAIAAGEHHTCAIATGGVAYCWGSGDVGQLGTGNTQSSPRPVAVTGSARFVSIDAAAEHTCAATATGELYCWGHNNFGRLGTLGLATITATPTRVVADTVQFSELSIGRLHSCGRTTTQSLYCWGFGGFGQLGNGSVVSRAAPTRVLIGTPAP